MRIQRLPILVVTFALLLLSPALRAQLAGISGKDDLVITQAGTTSATIVVSADASKWEKRAAEDLQKYIERMSGAKPALAATPDAISATLGKSPGPLILVGQQALAAEPGLKQALDAVAKKNPVVRADAIVVKRAGNRIYVAGTNDESHYFAVAPLLQQWGCRWYLPGEFGECIPDTRYSKSARSTPPTRRLSRCGTTG